MAPPCGTVTGRRRDRCSVGPSPCPQFFRAFFADHHSHCMKIPWGFRKHLGDVADGTCSLKGPGGKEWLVEFIKREEDGVFGFGCGWEAFAKDHCLETGEFLVFEYRGRSRFDVLIFDCSMCEKENAMAARPSHLEGLGAGKSRGNTPQWEGGALYHGGLGEEKVVPLPTKKSDRRLVLPFEPKNPFFASIICKSSFRRRMYVPKYFARLYLPHEEVLMSLRLSNGRKLFPVVCTHSSKKEHNLSRGWSCFFDANLLQMGDLCIFELLPTFTIGTKNHDPAPRQVFEFMVHLFREDKRLA